MNPGQYTIVAGALLAILVALAVGLGVFERPGKPPPDFQAAEARWRDSGITSYRLVIRANCECDGRPVQVTVRDGKLAEARYTETAEPVAWESGPQRPLTVEELLAAIARGYVQNFDHIDVTYDAVTGRPVEVMFDPAANTIDDEVGYEISDFEPLAPSP